MGGAWARHPPPDRSDSYLHPSSDHARTSTVANLAPADRGIAHANLHARPGAIRHTPTIADAPGADGGAADTHQHVQPRAIGDAPAIANFAPVNGGTADAHGHTAASHTLSRSHADQHAQPIGHSHRYPYRLPNRHAFTQSRHDHDAHCPACPHTDGV